MSKYSMEPGRMDDSYYEMMKIAVQKSNAELALRLMAERNAKHHDPIAYDEWIVSHEEARDHVIKFQSEHGMKPDRFPSNELLRAAAVSIAVIRGAKLPVNVRVNMVNKTYIVRSGIDKSGELVPMEFNPKDTIIDEDDQYPE